MNVARSARRLSSSKPLIANSGPRARYVAIFSYVEEPGMVGSPERTVQLYGRVLPIHVERAGLRGDALVD